MKNGGGGGAFKKQMFVQAKNFDSNGDGRTSSSSFASGQSFIDPATYMSNGEFVFKIPPEAPVFEPTVEEFLDPLAYINKIRPVAEKTGICKVKPPAEWHPPFAVDVDHFKFTPRIQKLNELDANTRVKLYFLDRLATYWNYNGGQIRIPAIDDKTVDMYSLYKLVELEGGFELVNAEKKWTRIASRMGYANEKAVAPQLRQHYKRLLLPYEKFEKMKAVREDGTKTTTSAANTAAPPLDNAAADEATATKTEDVDGTGASPHRRLDSISPNKATKTTTTVGAAGVANASSNLSRRCTRSTCDENDTEILVSDTFKNPIIQDKNKELQRLTFYGPGPKILGSSKSKFTSSSSQESSSPQKKWEAAGNSSSSSSSSAAVANANANQAKAGAQSVQPDLLADSACMVCGKGDSEESILLCDGCDDGYHTFCLIPPLGSIPKGEWRCPKCIAVVVSKASDTTSFGFEQAEREYSLQQFGEMADQFKSNYFNMPVHLVPTEKVEQEYWRILSSMDSNVTVEYGADLHSMDHGSGFPTQMALKQSGDENHYYKSYVESSWNLNNIPVLEGSVLGYINADISGMKIPWMYVGMCFSTFCWHNEDHWSYSINYLHWGEPKTWYGVPGFMAERFEQVMRETTPDLFRNQPDLLHQLVTILNPNILMDRGVPVYHIDQAAGEFVLTFPRAYHAGFNHGYNFAEAVNFAPVDWIPLGRECVEHYSSLHRYCVFSHDELICKMASVPENLNSRLASATHQDMLKMLDAENRQRKTLLEWGVVNAEREAFELLADDERKCAECNTTCFLSAVTCKCSPKKVTCLRHFEELCSCAPIEHTLRYRYTLDELPVMLEKLKDKADSVAAWAAKVHDAVDTNSPRTITLSGLKELLNEAREKHFPDDLSLNLLSKAIKSVQDALAVDFKNILSHKQTLSKKVTLTEIRSYYEELQRIPCVLPQENTVKHFLKFIDGFRANAERVLRDERSTAGDVENVLKQGHFPNVEIPLADALKNYKKILQLAEDYNAKLKNPNALLTTDVIDQLLACSKTINNPNERVIAINKELTQSKEKIISWEAKIKCYLADTAFSTNLLSDKNDDDDDDDHQRQQRAGGIINNNNNNNNNIINGNNNSSSSSSSSNAKNSSNPAPKTCLKKLENFLEEAEGIEAFLPSREKLRSVVTKASAWKKRAANVLLPKKSPPPFCEYVERLIDDGQSLRVEFEEMARLQSLAGKVSQWREEARRIFLGDCTAFGLLEILMPRRNLQRVCRFKTSSYDVVSSGGGGGGGGGETETSEKKLLSTSRSGGGGGEFDDLLAAVDIVTNENVDSEKIVASIKVAEKREFDLMRALRVKNTYKKKQGSATFCICAASSTHSMKECTLCKDFFHESCLKRLANYGEEKKSNSRIFLCSFCRRSRRPISKTVSNSYLKLCKLRARTLEGVAIRCLLDRETEWKDSVEQLLKTPELSLLSGVTAEIKSKGGGGGGGTPPFVLSAENKDRLESLLFRGFLLELDLPENEMIYKILQKLEENNCVDNAPQSATLPAASSKRFYDRVKAESELRRYDDITSPPPQFIAAADALQSYAKKNNKKTAYPAFGVDGGNKNRRANHTIYSRVDDSRVNVNVIVDDEDDADDDDDDDVVDVDVVVKTIVSKYHRKRKKSGRSGAGIAAKQRLSTSPNDAGRCKDLLRRATLNRNGADVIEPLLADLATADKSKNDFRRVAGEFVYGSGGGGRRGQTEQFVELVDDSDDVNEEDGPEQEEEESECVAKKCVKPSGEHVDWVQCDYCKNWLHMICIGVTKGEVDNQTEFMCSLCRSADSAKTKDRDCDDDEDDDVVFVEYASNNAALCSS